MNPLMIERNWTENTSLTKVHISLSEIIGLKESSLAQ
jgi:hypothetical protein